MSYLYGRMWTLLFYSQLVLRVGVQIMTVLKPAIFKVLKMHSTEIVVELLNSEKVKKDDGLPWSLLFFLLLFFKLYTFH